MDEDELLQLAASLEVVSEHHLGKTIVEKAEMRGLSVAGDPSDVDIMKGHGLKGMVGGRQVYIGNLSGAEKLDIAVDSEKGNYLLRQQERGRTEADVDMDHEARGR